MRRWDRDCIIAIFLTSLLLLYFYLYFNTDFRHILISIDSKTTATDSKDCGPNWSYIMNGPLAQNDTQLLNHIRQNFLDPPTPFHYPYNFSKEGLWDPSMGQATIIKRALKYLKNGFFVECGAFDGETRSNTLILERDLGWRGILIEPDYDNYHKLKTKRRKAWSANVCLSIKPYPHKALFHPNGSMGKLIQDDNSEGINVNIQCIPLYSLVSALNISRIDYLSLDVEGNEMEILQTIPFDSLYIKTISVEYIHDSIGRNGVRRWMNSRGFYVIGEVTHENNLANDWIFVNNN